MDQLSATDIFNTSIRDLPRTRLIQKRRNLLTLLNVDAFYPLSTWPQDIQQLFWKKPIGDTDTFKLMLFFLSNGCSLHLTEWILTSQHWTTIPKGVKRARQINFIIIHQTHYEKSDWSRAFNQFTMACELDMTNAISAAYIAFIMSSSSLPGY